MTIMTSTMIGADPQLGDDVRGNKDGDSDASDSDEDVDVDTNDDNGGVDGGVGDDYDRLCMQTIIVYRQRWGH